MEIPTVKIVNPKDSSEAVQINQADFNPEVHIAWDDRDKPRAGRQATETPGLPGTLLDIVETHADVRDRWTRAQLIEIAKTALDFEIDPSLSARKAREAFDLAVAEAYDRRARTGGR